MALREFTDSAGEAWEAFAVIPREHVRRHYDRRSTAAAKDVHLEDSEERRDGDRRLTVGHTSGRLDANGWLCFQHRDERRRLAPIPEDWRRCDESQLRAYLEAALPVRRLSTHGPRPT